MIFYQPPNFLLASLSRIVLVFILFLLFIKREFAVGR